MFVPPINLGQFQPSPATLADWIYQIWNYLQNNPIATQEQLQEYIATFITTSPETQELIGEGVEQYLTDNPPEAPVQSVQGKTGAVTLAFNDILKNNNTAPVYRAASMPSQSTLQAQYNLGYRLFVNTSTQEIYSITNTGGTTLVGKGKFDGTDIDLDTEQGDTTIAEALSKLNVIPTALLDWGNYYPGTYTLSDDMTKYDVILVQCGYSNTSATGGGAHCFYFVKPQTGSDAVYGCTYSAGGGMFVSSVRFTDSTHVEVTANYDITNNRTISTGGTCIRLIMGITIKA